jgi:hypothetical protein
LDKRLLKLRCRETDGVKVALDAAIVRIRHYRAKYPAINTNDWGYYLDGSQRRDFGSTGFTPHNYRMWELGSMLGRRLYLYEELLPGVKLATDDCALFGADTYALAIDDPEAKTYGGHHDGIARIELGTLAENSEYSLDAIIWMSSSLARLFKNEKSFWRAVKQFTKRFVHQARGDLTIPDQVHAP